MKINTRSLFRGSKGRARAVGTLIGMTFLALVLVLGLLTGCPTTTDNGDNGNGDTTPLPAFPMTVTDQLGRTVTIEAEPQKIISLAPSNTEIVFALGLGDKVVGVTQFCDYPAEALDKPKIGGFSSTDIDVSIEQLIVIQPDLILATETHIAEVIPKLEQLLPGTAIIVLLTQTETFDVVFDAITLVGQVVGKDDEAAQLVSDMQARIKAVTDKTAGLAPAERPQVLYIIWPDPIYAIASGTLGNALIEAAGGENLFADLTGAPIVSLETVIVRNPQVILGSASIGYGGDLPYQFALTESRLEGVDARINGQVYGVNDDLTGRPGPRMVEGLEMLAGMLHPDLFPEFFDEYVGSSS